jgi:sortase (surface protein transpeptidase)
VPRRLLRALCVAALAVGVSALGLSSAAAAAQDGSLRFAHLSPDTPAVDVYVDRVGGAGPSVLRGVSYGTVTGYRQLSPGRYTVAVRGARAAASTPPVLAATVQLGGGSARTMELAGSFATARLHEFADDLSPPPAGRARVRVLAAAASAGPVDVSLAGGVPVAGSLPFAHTSGYVDVPAGATTLTVVPGSGAGVVSPVTFAAGSVYSVVVLDRAGGGLAVRAVLDAAGPATVPVGGVETGAGGTAASSPWPSPWLPVGLAGLAALAPLAARRSRLGVGLVAVTLGAAAGFVAVVPSAGPVSTPLAVHPVAFRETAPDVPTAAPVVPVRVRIPAIGVDSRLARLGTEASGALLPPADFAQAGWFAGGPAPGGVGPAVLAGHVDSFRGPAVFFRLSRLHSGDDVLVTRADGTTLRFTVTRTARYPKSAFPTAEVYGPAADAELRLITCGGRFDSSRRSYVDDVVVFARLR